MSAQPTPQPAKKSAWKIWGTGALNAAISGATSGGAAQFVGIPMKQSLYVAGASAVVSLMKWLAQHPLPGAE